MLAILEIVRYSPGRMYASKLSLSSDSKMVHFVLKDEVRDKVTCVNCGITHWQMQQIWMSVRQDY